MIPQVFFFRVISGINVNFKRNGESIVNKITNIEQKRQQMNRLNNINPIIQFPSKSTTHSNDIFVQFPKKRNRKKRS